jgi:hypothetical protein
MPIMQLEQKLFIANHVVTRELSDSQATKEFWRDLSLCCALIMLAAAYLGMACAEYRSLRFSAPQCGGPAKLILRQGRH